jgi:hypothetical protein
LAQLVETALQEESEEKSQKFKGNQKLAERRELWRTRRDNRPQIKREVNAVTSVECYRCQRAGHLANNFRNKPTCGTCHRVGHVTEDCRARGSQGNGQYDVLSNRESPTR